MAKQKVELKDEEFLCDEDTMVENTDGTITLEGRILIYTNKGTYDKVVKVRLDKPKR